MGLVSTTQDTAHLQSHFMAYRDGILNHPKLRRFWSGVRVEPTKRDLILRYEIGLGRLLRRSGIGYGAGFDWERVVPGREPDEPGWRRLMLMGFPFVKRGWSSGLRTRSPTSVTCPASSVTCTASTSWSGCDEGPRNFGWAARRTREVLADEGAAGCGAGR